jgi:hypothetical protein
MALIFSGTNLLARAFFSDLKNDSLYAGKRDRFSANSA